jgi:hypothetical protein
VPARVLNFDWKISGEISYENPYLILVSKIFPWENANKKKFIF